MKPYAGSFPKVEDIMTPRSSFVCVEEHNSDAAEEIASEKNFDVVPIVCSGEIPKYWSREDKCCLRITKRHRSSHDASLEAVLPRLNNHLVQFIYYRSEIVGLVDISDLNKPLARLAWIQPVLEFEQWLLNRVNAGGFTEAQMLEALGNAAKETKRRQQRAHEENLDLPLLSFAHFGQLLKACVALAVVELSGDDIQRLSPLRNKLAHGARQLIEKRKDGEELVWATNIIRSQTKGRS